MVRKALAKLLVAGACLGLAVSAHAHVWQIAWNANNDGSVTFYGLSYHSPNASLDNFALNPAGFVINGTNVGFDLGSTVALEGCSSGGGVAGTCSAIWNSLGLDGSVVANGYSIDSYAKYASAHLDAAALAALGIGAGSNSVLFTTFANNVDYAGESFTSATVPINIVIPPPVDVPEPATLALLGAAGVAAFAGRRRRQAAA